MEIVMRLHARTGAIENESVNLPESAHWLAAYVHELTTFPYSKHDDRADHQGPTAPGQRQPHLGIVKLLSLFAPRADARHAQPKA
jgi:hypothetical protein